jgi:predicted nucleic acid-binding protein
LHISEEGATVSSLATYEIYANARSKTFGHIYENKTDELLVSGHLVASQFYHLSKRKRPHLAQSVYTRKVQ